MERTLKHCSLVLTVNKSLVQAHTGLTSPPICEWHRLSIDLASQMTQPALFSICTFSLDLQCMKFGFFFYKVILLLDVFFSLQTQREEKQTLRLPVALKRVDGVLSHHHRGFSSLLSLQPNQSAGCIAYLSYWGRGGETKVSYFSLKQETITVLRKAKRQQVNTFPLVRLPKDFFSYKTTLNRSGMAIIDTIGMLSRTLFSSNLWSKEQPNAVNKSLSAQQFPFSPLLFLSSTLPLFL